MPAFNNPPALTISKSYETLKTEIKMWETLTPLPANKRALASAVRLSGKAICDVCNTCCMYAPLN